MTVQKHSSDLVLVGEIGAPFGIRGEVKMVPLVRNPEWLRTLSFVTVVFPTGQVQHRTIQTWRRHHGICLVGFEGMDRNAAEAMRGSEVRVPQSSLPPLPVGEYYEFELLGMTVVTDSGIELGPIERVHYSEKANDIWETSLAMVPLVPEFVLDVDLTQRRVVVKDDPGMIK